MGDGRISEVGHLSTTHEGIISQWAQLAAEARSASGRTAACPSGGTLRERSQLLRAINRLQFRRNVSDDALVCSQQNIINIFFDVSILQNIHLKISYICIQYYYVSKRALAKWLELIF